MIHGTVSTQAVKTQTESSTEKKKVKRLLRGSPALRGHECH